MAGALASVGKKAAEERRTIIGVDQSGCYLLPLAVKSPDDEDIALAYVGDRLLEPITLGLGGRGLVETKVAVRDRCAT